MKMDQHFGSNCGTVTPYGLLRTQKALIIGHGVEENYLQIMDMNSECTDGLWYIGHSKPLGQSKEKVFQMFPIYM
jgi:hypothetical protein